MFFVLQSMDPSDLWFQHAQPQNYDDVLQDSTPSQDTKEKKKKKKNRLDRKKLNPAVLSSYVITKAPKRALRMIKIEIHDLNGPQTSTNSDDSVVSVQYIQSEVVDEIMDLSENLVNKICKKICNDSI